MVRVGRSLDSTHRLHFIMLARQLAPLAHRAHPAAAQDLQNLHRHQRLDYFRKGVQESCYECATFKLRV